VSTTVLATKLFAPIRRERLVARSRLAEELDTSLASHQRLTLVSAPAGFGKTTLLGDWIDSLRRRRPDVGVGWLSLDSGDNDLWRLSTHLAAALGRSGLEVDLTGLEQGPADASAILTRLLNDVVRASEQTSERHWLVVLDDYHVIDSPAVHQALGFLLDHLPPGLHLVVATRSDPPLPLPRLRSRGQLVELRAAELRFTPGEAREFLNHVMGLDLAEDDVGALEERTEGWVAGLQLAALSLRSTRTADDTAAFIDAFTGSNRFVLDYLVDEVLARLAPQAHQFLLQTSVLDRLTGPLCDAVTSGSGGAGMLERLERDNVFVVALDRERVWFRYHHLFADVLRARLLADQDHLAPVLHSRASEWYAAHDLMPEAVAHALAGEDTARAAYLVELALPQMRRGRQDATLLGWIGALPDSVVRRSPVLNILSGWSMMLAGDLDAMEARLDDAEAALALGREHPSLAATWADTEDLRTAPATVNVYRAALAQARGDVPSTVEHAQRALDLAGPDDHFVRGAAGGFLGLAAWATGDVERALRTFTDAGRSLHSAGNLVDELDTTVVLGDMWMTAGRPREARRTYEQALVRATAQGEPYPRATPDLHVGLAELDREGNDLTGAQAHLDLAKVLGEQASITEKRHQWFVASAHLRTATGDHAAALELLDRAHALYRPGSYPDIRPIAAIQARVHIAAGDLDAARRWASDHDVALDEDVTFLHEYEQLTLVRLHLATHERGTSAHERNATAAVPLDDVRKALQRLDAAAPSARGGTLLEVGMLQALTLHAMGDLAEALSELDRVLATAHEPESYVRLFLDEGAPMLALLRAAAVADDRHPHAVEHARRLLTAAAGAAADTSDVPAPRATTGEALAEPLSDREVEVLRLLATELSGPEIARQLYVSLNTLRTHTKRIFTKLGVRNRAAAVRRGRQLGLL
jgi:LuxR family transcriptional regulator, maltose regulon positive regulatory protein